MKNEIPKPIIGIAVAVVLVLVGIFFVKGLSGPEEFPAAKRLPNYKEGIPDYVKSAKNGERPAPGSKLGDTSHLTPEQKKLIEDSMARSGKQ